MLQFSSNLVRDATFPKPLSNLSESTSVDISPSTLLSPTSS